jgi:predicted TIM-barrel fold metal-dependent hydrolase
MEEPDVPEDVLLTFEQIGWDRLLFATDYPHWDFDDPRNALKVQLPEARRRMLFRENAARLYRLH